jgi:uncharacterized membrane protein
MFLKVIGFFMDMDKQRQEMSLIGRILSLEALLALMGLVDLVYGVINAELLNIFIGAVILGLLALLMYRRKITRN